MIKIPDRPTVYFDVDDTLVLWREPRDGETPIQIDTFNLTVSTKHVRCLKEHAARKHPIVVWSQGGADWAETVVVALGLEKYVDLVISKPRWFYDDMSPKIWLDGWIYKEGNKRSSYDD